MAQASGPSHLLEADPNAEAELNPNDLETIQSKLNNSNDSLLQEFCYEEEDDDDDTLSNGSVTDTRISLSEVEIGNDRQTQTQNLENTDESIVKENAKLKSEITRNKSEIESLKEKLTAVEELVSQLATKLEYETEKRNKTTRSMKQEISETKQFMTAIQNDKTEMLDKKTIEKNAEKHFTKKLNELDFEIIDARDLIKKNADNYEKLLTSLNDLKRSIKENTNAIKNVTEDYKQPKSEKIKVSSQSHQATAFETPLAEPTSAKPFEESVRMRPSESRGARSLNGPPRTPRNGPSYNGETSTLIVGDSILKGIFPRKIDFSGSTKIRTLRGRQLHDVRNFLAKLDLTSLDTLIIHAGTNDVPKFTGAEIVAFFEETIRELKSAHPNLTIFISSILPREDLQAPTIPEKINFINEKLKVMSMKLHFHIIDNNDTLHDPDLRYDGLHLTERGTALLVRNFKDAYLPSETRGNIAPQRASGFKGYRGSIQHDNSINIPTTMAANTQSMPNISPNHANQSTEVFGSQNYSIPLQQYPGQQYPSQWTMLHQPPLRNSVYPQNGVFQNPWNQFNVGNPFGYQNRQLGIPIPVY